MKLKLNQDIAIDDFFETSRLIGIMAPVKNYFFCWRLNNILGTSFTLNNSLEIVLRKKQRHYFFNVYEYNEPNTALVHYIYHNQFDGEYLLPEFKNLDFLWLMKGENVDDEKCTHIISSIKEINEVQLVAELTNEKIVNKGNMVF